VTDTYTNLVNTNPVGKKIAGRLGLPRPAQLRRYEEGQDLLGGPAAVAGIGDAPVAAAAAGVIKASGADVVEASAEASYDRKLGAIVFDASAARTLDQLEGLGVSRAVLSLPSAGDAEVLRTLDDFAALLSR